VALHKAEGKELPPEIIALLDRFRAEARARRESPPASPAPGE